MSFRAKFGNQNKLSFFFLQAKQRFGMEKLQNDEKRKKGIVNYDLKQAASHRLPGSESAAKYPMIFFPFPFPPYDIQERFMTTLFHVLEDCNVGIFESPTGTVGDYI